MAKIKAFETHADLYEAWFEKHPKLYAAEVEAIRELLPPFEKGIEIGVGSGRFALPFGIKEGVDPSPKMAEISRSKGIVMIDGVAEALPLESSAYDLAVMVTTICFVDDPLKSLKEVHRILRPGGCIIIGFIDRESPIGKRYQKERLQNPFYAEATFFGAAEVAALLETAGFGAINALQTLFGPDPEEVTCEIEKGYGKGSFVAIRAEKKIPGEEKVRQKSLIHSILKSANSFAMITPMLLGVILCIGLFETLVTEEMLRSLFGGNPVYDTLVGTLIGGVSVGQPVASYIIGGELLESGVSLYAVSAFIVSWVTIGVIQLPLERELFGTRFTLQRNLLSVLFALIVAAAVASIVGALQ